MLQVSCGVRGQHPMLFSWDPLTPVRFSYLYWTEFGRSNLLYFMFLSYSTNVVWSESYNCCACVGKWEKMVLFISRGHFSDWSIGSRQECYQHAFVANWGIQLELELQLDLVFSFAASFNFCKELVLHYVCPLFGCYVLVLCLFWWHRLWDSMCSFLSRPCAATSSSSGLETTLYVLQHPLCQSSLTGPAENSYFFQRRGCPAFLYSSFLYFFQGWKG